MLELSEIWYYCIKIFREENTAKEEDGGTGGNDAPGGDQAESGGTVGAADSHISDADSGTAGIADEMSVQKDGSPDHRDHGEGSTTDTAEPAGDTVPEGGLSNPDSIFPAVAAVPAEVVDRLDELLADTTGEPATDSKQAEPQPTMGKVEQVIWDEQPTSSLSEAGIATVYKGNIIKNLIMDCQSYTKYRPNETTGGIFVSWRRKEELPTGA